MTDTSANTTNRSYLRILELQLKELNANLIILDIPQIALPTRARSLTLELKAEIRKFPLDTPDLQLIDDYLSAAMEFCDHYFETESTNAYAIFPLKLPCDSRELLKVHEELYQRYCALHARIFENSRR